MKKLLSGTLVLAGLTLIVISLDKFQGEHQESSLLEPRSLLGKRMLSDIETLHNNQELPNEWNLVREFRLTSTSPQTDKWTKNFDLKIPTSASGSYRLESVIIAESPNDPNSRAMVQYGLYEVKSGNKVWEKIRIYDVR